MKKRLDALEERCKNNKNNKKIAIWPAADYVSRVLDYWNNDEFERRCVFVNAPSAMWGKEFRGKRIVAPDELRPLHVDSIVFMHHRLQSALYKEASVLFPSMKIVSLHEAFDIDWFNRMI